MEGDDRTEVLREKVFLSTNMNGWEVEDERQQSGAKLTRSAALRMAARRNKVDVIGVQEHHFRSHEGLQEGTRRLRGLEWGYAGNTSLTPKSGTMVLWKPAVQAGHSVLHVLAHTGGSTGGRGGPAVDSCVRTLPP